MESNVILTANKELKNCYMFRSYDHLQASTVIPAVLRGDGKGTELVSESKVILIADKDLSKKFSLDLRPSSQ
jgi:hypothetical protein